MSGRQPRRRPRNRAVTTAPGPDPAPLRGTARAATGGSPEEGAGPSSEESHRSGQRAPDAVPAEAARSLHAALRNANHPGYLGDLNVVDGVLRDLARDYVERTRIALEQPDPMAAIEASTPANIEDASRVWRILTGQDPAYRGTTIHTPEALDAHILRHYPKASPDCPTLMAIVDFMTMLGVAIMQADDDEAAAEALVSEAFATYTRLFVGLPPPASGRTEA